MASNNYFGGYYASNHQQSQPQQQYSGYQTAPAANNVPPTRQYQGAPPTVTTQSMDYMSHSSYSGQGMYNGQEDGSWGQNNYGSSRESTRGAAEVLSNMSNNSYASNSVNISNAPRQPTSQVHQPHQSDATRSSHAHVSYGQATQPRPRSVNTHRAQTPSNRGLPSPQYLPPRAQSFINQQRPASPVQLQYPQQATHSVHPNRSSNTPSGISYTDYNNRQLPGVASNASPLPTSYSQQVPEPVAHTDPTHQYNQTNATVDPTVVYDPWPEIHRKQEAARAKQAAEDAARFEEERKVEEERRKAEQKAEEGRKAQEAQQKQQSNTSQPAVAERSAEPPQGSDDGGSGALEAEIRAMMAKMRELNSKDPSLLARIWEEERKVKTPKAPTAQNKPSQPPASKPADPLQQPPAPQATHQKKSSAPRPAPTSNKQATTTAKPTPPPTPQPTASQSQAKPTGGTIWPQDKKGQLASAAAAFLNRRNPDKSVTSEKILQMLDSNPTYIQLCEELEAMGLKLDRGALARDLLTAVPDVNSASKAQAQGQTKAGVQAQALAQRQATVGPSYINGSAHKVPPPAIIRNATNKLPTSLPTTTSQQSTSAAPSPYAARSPYSPFPNLGSTPQAAAPVAQMVSIKPELKPPANKEEAARKRTFNDLIDLTQDPDREDGDLPPPKKLHLNSPSESVANESAGMANNFPRTAAALPQPDQIPSALQPRPVDEARFKNIVQPIDKKDALRRNAYNIKTIARDVLLACGRHPEQRPLNQHLEILKQNLPTVDIMSDLSTLKWDVIDPGQPPVDYFRSTGVSGFDDADDEGESEDDGDRALERSQTIEQQAVGVGDGNQGRVRVHLSTNPFKKKGRPPRASYPMAGETALHSELSPQAKQSPKAPASAPRPLTAGVGYAAFQGATNADGTPAKRRGRPVGWRKAIHGSAAAQARTAGNRFTSTTPRKQNTSHNDKSGGKSPILISSRSPSVANAGQHISTPKLRAFKCEWHNCHAELHNLDTLRKHVVKVHNKQTLRGTYECLWGDCGKVSTSVDQVTGIRIEKNTPFSFISASEWKAHLESAHLTPLSWTLGDGPASGLSDTYDSASEAYMSDAHGRRVTPRITVSPSRFQGQNTSQATSLPAPRGRGRPPKSNQEREARAMQQSMVAQKKRVGGPGMDRGGASLVNDKRRRGFSDNDETEEFINAED